MGTHTHSNTANIADAGTAYSLLQAQQCLVALASPISVARLPLLVNPRRACAARVTVVVLCVCVCVSPRL